VHVAEFLSAVRANKNAQIRCSPMHPFKTDHYLLVVSHFASFPLIAAVSNGQVVGNQLAESDDI